MKTIQWKTSRKGGRKLCSQSITIMAYHRKLTPLNCQTGIALDN